MLPVHGTEAPRRLGQREVKKDMEKLNSSVLKQTYADVYLIDL
jgi:hypothetical protein